MTNHVNTRPVSSWNVESAIEVPQGTIQIVHINWAGKIDMLMRPRRRYWLDFCLTPRPYDLRASYLERWGAYRFERMGDVFLVPPGEELLIYSDPTEQIQSSSQSLLACHLEPELISQWFGGDMEWTERLLAAGLDITNRSIRGLLMRLAKEMLNPRFGSEKIVELLCCHLAIELGRYFSKDGLIPLKGGLAAWRLRLIDHRVNEVGPSPSVVELAELCNISVRQLSRGFQASRGESVGRFIEQSRMENAKRLILKGEEIRQVAERMGYSSQSSFSYAFRRALGVTPAQFRKRG